MLQNPRTAIIVLGMHRSGTSAMTRLLNLWGCETAKDLLKPASDNPKGFWESESAYHLNDRIFNSLKSSWNDFVPLPQNFESLPGIDDFSKEISGYLSKHFSNSDLFVMKDPRFCKLFPIWAEALKRFYAEIRVVLVIRHPKEVAASLYRRQQYSEDYSCLLWLKHNIDAEFYSRGYLRAVVSFDSFLENWRQTRDRIEEALAMRFPMPNEACGAAIEAFLDQEDRHHVFENKGKDHPPDSASGWDLAISIFEQFKQIEQRGYWTDSDRRSADTWQKRFQDITHPAGSRIIDVVNHFWLNEVKYLRGLIESLEGECNSWQKAYDRLNEGVESLEKDRNIWRSTHEQYASFMVKEQQSWRDSQQDLLDRFNRMHDEMLRNTAEDRNKEQEAWRKAQDEALHAAAQERRNWLAWQEEYLSYVGKEREDWRAAYEALSLQNTELTDRLFRINDELSLLTQEARKVKKAFSALLNTPVIRFMLKARILKQKYKIYR